jgi:hypothetical protein
MNDPQWESKQEDAKSQGAHAKFAGLAADGRPEVRARAAASSFVVFVPSLSVECCVFTANDDVFLTSAAAD